MSNFIKAIIAVAFVLFGCAVAASDNTDYECGNATVLVGDGDTIWAIAEKVCTGNIQVAIDHAIELNGGTTSIVSGEWIQLP